MSYYGLNTAKFGTHQLIADELGSGKKVLDVGCNKGYIKALAKGCDFYGIDFDSRDLREAKKIGYKQVFQLDLNDFAKLQLKGKFNVIMLADILEHLIFPEKVLKYFVDHYLEDDGTVLISLPNVANFVIRLNLLFGNFNYTESGILDKTHLHLYTLKTARKLIASGKLIIIKEKFSSNLFGNIIKILPFLGTFFGFNLIFVCQKKS